MTLAFWILDPNGIRLMSSVNNLLKLTCFILECHAYPMLECVSIEFKV